MLYTDKSLLFQRRGEIPMMIYILGILQTIKIALKYLIMLKIHPYILFCEFVYYSI